MMEMKMDRRTLLACLAGALAALAAGCADSNALRVGSYNIRTGGADKKTPNAWAERREDLAALVRKMDLDVFGLQEVVPEQTAFLCERLPEYGYVGEYRNADRTSGEASPVYYRKDRFEMLKSGTFWLSETPDVPGLKGWGAACPRVCSYAILRDKRTGGKFCFANTHTDHVSALAREKGMMLILERMKEFGEGAPIVFTGDHNCRETDAPAIAVSGVLANALYASETLPKGSWRTFNGWNWKEREVSTAAALAVAPGVRNAISGSPDGTGRKPEEYGARIDYIYVTPGTRVLGYETVDSPRPGTKLYPSDHFPVVATIEF